MPHIVFEKHFTVKEANRLIPVLKNYLEQIQVQQKCLLALFPQVRELIEHKTGDFGFSGSAEYLQRASEITHLVMQIAKEGVIIKDLSRGLVDFPHILENREVYLCWELGEEEVLFWHELDDGFAGRKSLYLKKPK